MGSQPCYPRESVEWNDALPPTPQGVGFRADTVMNVSSTLVLVVEDYPSLAAPVTSMLIDLEVSSEPATQPRRLSESIPHDDEGG
jgi:hypothetical protein